MSEAASPTWIYKRDGRLVPFEPDKISQALFAATEALGHPDAFVARELADGVLHFLAQEEGVPTTAQLGELVAKVVRELGQPALAQAFADATTAKQRVPAATAEVTVTFCPSDPPRAVVAKCLRAYSLHAVFTRDLAAAQQDGLLSLLGLEAPLQLAACVIDVIQSVHGDVGGALAAAKEQAQVVSIDSPEYLPGSNLSESGSARLATALRPGTVINLGCKLPPAWASEQLTGPLFAQQATPAISKDPAASAIALLEQLLPVRNNCRVDWHLGEGDFVDAPGIEYTPSLLRLARLAVESPQLTFTFDRARRPVVLGEGLDRQHAGVLLAVGLHLPRLLELPGVRGQPAVFLQKLATLGRLALSAAVQKRNYLRKTATALARGFLLERARLLIVPVGLDAAVRTLTGCALAEGKPGLDLGRHILEHLRGVLQEDGRRANLDSCIDGVLNAESNGPRAFRLEPETGSSGEEVPLPQITGPTPWDPTAAPRQLLRAAGVLHAAAGGGTAALFVSGSIAQDPRAVVDLLSYAWRQTDIARLRLLLPSQGEQATLLPS